MRRHARATGKRGTEDYFSGHDGPPLTGCTLCTRNWGTVVDPLVPVAPETLEAGEPAAAACTT
ncbi:MAG TPA: hypothetical protein VNZ26_00040, partial [Vicinamibacterales bacterium]|nr:hypothetical protein [Vicinamibacterales bacterium]